VREGAAKRTVMQRSGRRAERRMFIFLHGFAELWMPRVQ
jgi:hypothetical protein